MHTPLVLRIVAAAASAVTSAVLLTAMAWLPGAGPSAAAADLVVVAQADGPAVH